MSNIRTLRWGELALARCPFWEMIHKHQSIDCSVTTQLQINTLRSLIWHLSRSGKRANFCKYGKAQTSNAWTNASYKYKCTARWQLDGMVNIRDAFSWFSSKAPVRPAPWEWWKKKAFFRVTFENGQWKLLNIQKKINDQIILSSV